MNEALPVSISLAVSASSAEANVDNPAARAKGNRSLCMALIGCGALTLDWRDFFRNPQESGFPACRNGIAKSCRAHGIFRGFI
jgi:hypothetical protein